MLKLKENLQSLDLEDKEVFLLLEDGTTKEGVVRISDKKSILLLEHGNWDSEEKVNLSDIKKLFFCPYPYYDMRHKTFLRESKIPLPDLRFKEDELAKLTNCFLLINYDGKIINGKLKKYFKIKNEVGFIKTFSLLIETDEEEKEIEDYRIRSLEVTGKTELENKRNEKLRELEEVILLLHSGELDNKIMELDFDLKDPDELAERYFEIKIKEKKGEFETFEDSSYNWAQEIVKKTENANSAPNLSLYEDLKIAREINCYYVSKLEFIDKIVDTIEKVDWKPLFGSQEQGELCALEYMWKSDLLST